MKSENHYLVRRRDMLRMLRTLCESFADATLEIAGDDGDAWSTTFLKYEQEHLWVAVPDNWNAIACHQIADDLIGIDLTISFSLPQGRYVFNTVVTQKRILADHTYGPVDALRVSLPLRLNRMETRTEFRSEVTASQTIQATLAPTGGSRQTCALQFQNISAQGIGATVIPEPGSSLELNTPYWMEFELERDEQPLSLIVQLRHMKPLEDGAFETGWSLCPSDDASTSERQLRRLHDYLTQSTAVA